MENNREFLLIINDLIDNDTVKKLKDYRQHYDTSRYEHCLQVAYFSYLVCKKLGLDYKAAARSGMLHDLFLYDWRINSGDRKRFHGFHHPRTALNNSLEITALNTKEQDIILKHMWPLTVILPKYKESYIVSFVDKYCVLSESYEYYRKKKLLQKVLNYSYLFFGLLIFKVV